VLCVETIGKIRRRRLVQGESISAIARDLGLARNTVKKALRLESGEFEYRRRRQPRPKLGAFLGTLETWLEAEEKLPARERRTAQRIYEALCVEGYTGAVDAVRRHMRVFERRHRHVQAYIPQSFEPGEAYQFDWSHEHVELGGVDQVVKVAHAEDGSALRASGAWRACGSGGENLKGGVVFQRCCRQRMNRYAVRCTPPMQPGASSCIGAPSFGRARRSSGMAGLLGGRQYLC
jgi:transposase-like protein